MLTWLVTKKSQTGRGAGTLLVKWGLEQARKQNVPAFVDALPLGAPLFEGCGFVKLGEQKTDLKQFGVDEPSVVVGMIADLALES